MTHRGERMGSFARLAAVTALAGALVVVMVGSSTGGTGGPGSYGTVPAGLAAPGSSQVGYVPPDLRISRSFAVQGKLTPDFTFTPLPSGAALTSRTDVGLRAALSTGLLALANARCWDAHEWNPTSDHPLGKACDLFQTYTTAAGVATGWKLANWFVANQAVLGINYVIWQNKIWSAGSPAAWGPYYSTVYGCPDENNITGCHMDHIHVSFY